MRGNRFFLVAALFKGDIRRDTQAGQCRLVATGKELQALNDPAPGCAWADAERLGNLSLVQACNQVQRQALCVAVGQLSQHRTHQFVA
jgi:hypothetical protein